MDATAASSAAEPLQEGRTFEKQSTGRLCDVNILKKLPRQANGSSPIDDVQNEVLESGAISGHAYPYPTPVCVILNGTPRFVAFGFNNPN